ncbi:MAG: hypothetical protein GWP14_09550 [Actinobacteria bacterium]|nr:hypothetical protein [Actinomycetota bacterium]
MMHNHEDSPRSRFGKSLLTEYREEMLHRKAVTHEAEAQEEIEQLIELADDLNVLLERG